MASVMLATHPEVFVCGSIIAGLPFGAAASVPQAFERMRGRGLVAEVAFAAVVERASPYRGPWPTVPVWHGDANQTVDVQRGRCGRSVAGAPRRKPVARLRRNGRQPPAARLARARRGGGMPHNRAGRRYAAEDQRPASCGAAGPHMLDAGISSTWRQAERWGLLGTAPTGYRRGKSLCRSRRARRRCRLLPPISAEKWPQPLSARCRRQD